MDTDSEVTPRQVADGCSRSETSARTGSDTATETIASKFGNRFIYENDNGNLAIDKKVLAAFRKLTKESVVWERAGRYWRVRTQETLLAGYRISVRLRIAISPQSVHHYALARFGLCAEPSSPLEALACSSRWFRALRRVPHFRRLHGFSRAISSTMPKDAVRRESASIPPSRAYGCAVS